MLHLVRLRPATTVVLAVLVLLAAAGCGASITFGSNVEATGELVSVPFDLADFDSIEVGNTFEAFIKVGEPISVEVLVNESLVDELDIRVRNGELLVGLRNGVSVRNGTLEATIRLPVLVELDVSGASATTVTGADGSALVLDVSGASDLIVEGTATAVTVDGSGSSDIELRLDGLESAQVDLSGASSLDLASAEPVSGDMSGASSLHVPAGALVSVSTSGASSIAER